MEKSEKKRIQKEKELFVYEWLSNKGIIHGNMASKARIELICVKMGYTIVSHKTSVNNLYQHICRDKKYSEKLLNKCGLVSKQKANNIKMKNSFYSSPEWRALRVEAFLKYGRRCCLCGRTALDGVTLHVDHIKPRSKYPEHELDINNLQILCEDCNLGKSNNYSENWRKH